MSYNHTLTSTVIVACDLHQRADNYYPPLRTDAVRNVKHKVMTDSLIEGWLMLDDDGMFNLCLDESTVLGEGDCINIEYEEEVMCDQPLIEQPSHTTHSYEYDQKRVTPCGN